jgi:hypothetical protein
MSTKGISKLTFIENEVREIRIAIGEDFDNCMERIQEGNNKFAILTHLNDKMLIPGFDITKYDFDIDRADDNSFDMSDAEIKARHGFVILPESKRVVNLLAAFSESERFQFPFQEISGWKPETKTMSSIIEHLSIADDSELGQSKFQAERDQINSKKLRTDQTALLTEKKVYPKGSCTNHPESTTHNTAGCFKGKKDSSQDITTGHSKDKDEVIPGKHKCKYCVVNHPRIHKTHPSDKCTKDPKSSQYNKPFNKKGADNNSSNTKYSALDAKIDKIALMLKNATTEDDST